MEKEILLNKKNMHPGKEGDIINLLWFLGPKGEHETHLECAVQTDTVVHTGPQIHDRVKSYTTHKNLMAYR